jgi:hypothetical protein
LAALGLAALSASPPALSVTPESLESLGLVPASKVAHAPDFQLPTIDMGEVSLAEHLGHVVVLNFWTTW